MVFPKMEPPKKEIIRVDDYVVKNNTVYEGNILKTRNGIKPTGNVLYENEVNDTQSFTLSDAVYFKNGRYNRLCVQYRTLGSFNYQYDFKLVSITGVVVGAGTIEIKREADGAAKKPLSIICFSAAAKKGCGIYAIINCENSLTGYSYYIYELNSTLKEWILLTENDIYIPLYLKNGRGSNYLMSETKLPDPEYPEELNMLGGVCCCSYTTDGVSGSYYLPIESSLDKVGHIRAKYIADDKSSFEFTFPKDSFVSNQISYQGYNIALTYNNGYIQFSSTPTGFVPPRVWGMDNNLKVYVNHETVADYEKKAFMTLSHVTGLAGEGEQVVLLGNKKYPSLVLVSKPSNPLYFPKNLSLNVGSDAQVVMGAAGLNNKLILFKEGSVYRGMIKGEKVSLEILSNNFGCAEAKSIRSTKNAAFFVGNDNKIYAVLPSGEIKEISTQINKYIEDFRYVMQTSSMASSSRYILFADKMAYCLDLNKSDLNFDKPQWDIWIFPVQMMLCDAFEYSDKTIFICSTANGNSIKYYLSDFSGEGVDEFYPQQDYENQKLQEPITTIIETGVINPDNSFTHKMIERAVFFVDNKAYVKIQFCNNKGAILKSSGINMSYGIKGKKAARVYTLFPTTEFSVRLETQMPFELEGIEFRYYKLD